MQLKYLFFASSLLFMSSCDKLGPPKELTERLDKIEKSQKIVMAQMSKLQKIVMAKTAKPKNLKPAQNLDKVYKVDTGDSVVYGEKNAPVTIVKWFDFQCPYCAQSVSLVDKIMKKYPKQVKVVLKNFPLGFHKQAKKAALYSLAAEKQGKYMEMYHGIFKDYRKLKENEDYPLEVAKNLGLNIEQLKKDMKDPALQTRISKEMAQLKGAGFARLGVPKFIINGKEPRGRDFHSWSKMIDDELTKITKKKTDTKKKS